MAKAKLSLQNLSVPQKVQFLRQVVTAMTGNANYATPAPTLASITTKTDDLETKFNEAQAARLTAQQKTSLQDTAERDADAAVTQLASYVENTSAGDSAKIQSAGMEVRATPAPVGTLPAPAGIVATL